jgi:hypothetical protein
MAAAPRSWFWQGGGGPPPQAALLSVIQQYNTKPDDDPVVNACRNYFGNLSGQHEKAIRTYFIYQLPIWKWYERLQAWDASVSHEDPNTMFEINNSTSSIGKQLKLYLAETAKIVKSENRTTRQGVALRDKVSKFLADHGADDFDEYKEESDLLHRKDVWFWCQALIYISLPDSVLKPQQEKEEQAAPVAYDQFAALSYWMQNKDGKDQETKSPGEQTGTKGIVGQLDDGDDEKALGLLAAQGEYDRLTGMLLDLKQNPNAKKAYDAILHFTTTPDDKEHFVEKHTYGRQAREFLGRVARDNPQIRDLALSWTLRSAS